MSVSISSTATRTLTYNETPTRLSPVKCALLVGLQVFLVVVCMAVIIRELVIAGEPPEATLLREPSGSELPPEQQSRIWEPGGVTEHSTGSSKSPTPQKKAIEDSGLPDCMEETGKTKMAKAVWVFVAGALLNSERARSVIVAGAL